MKFEYILFTLIFFYISLWIQIKLFLSSLGQKKFPISTIQNEKLQKLIYNKTGVGIKSIKISESNHPFGMMIGIPTRPQLILSRKLYETFNPQEMEYVVLHEAGHYKLWHSVIEFTVGLLLLVIGFLILKNILFLSSVIIAVILGVVFGMVMIQIGRLHEYQTDGFTVKRISNPRGMIQATDKFRNFHGKKYSENKNKLLQFLFYRGNPYDSRIKMAEKEIEIRK